MGPERLRQLSKTEAPGKRKRCFEFIHILELPSVLFVLEYEHVLPYGTQKMSGVKRPEVAGSPARHHPPLNTSENQSPVTPRQHGPRVPLGIARRIAPPGSWDGHEHLPESPVRGAGQPPAPMRSPPSSWVQFDG